MFKIKEKEKEKYALKGKARVKYIFF